MIIYSLLNPTTAFKVNPRLKYVSWNPPGFKFFTAKLREAFLFEVLNSFGIFLITFAILKNPFANPLKKVANLLMEFAMFLKALLHYATCFATYLAMNLF